MIVIHEISLFFTQSNKPMCFEYFLCLIKFNSIKIHFQMHCSVVDPVNIYLVLSGMDQGFILHKMNVICKKPKLVSTKLLTYICI